AQQPLASSFPVFLLPNSRGLASPRARNFDNRREYGQRVGTNTEWLPWQVRRSVAESITRKIIGNHGVIFSESIIHQAHNNESARRATFCKVRVKTGRRRHSSALRMRLFLK